MDFVIETVSYTLLEKKLEHSYFFEVKLFGSHKAAAFWCKRLWGTFCFFSYTSSTLYETNRENKHAFNLLIWLPAWTERNCRSLSTFQVFWILVKCSREYLSCLSNTVSSSSSLLVSYPVPWWFLGNIHTPFPNKALWIVFYMLTSLLLLILIDLLCNISSSLNSFFSNTEVSWSETLSIKSPARSSLRLLFFLKDRESGPCLFQVGLHKMMSILHLLNWMSFSWAISNVVCFEKGLLEE